jgi:hypothetical protein
MGDQRLTILEQAREVAEVEYAAKCSSVAGSPDEPTVGRFSTTTVATLPDVSLRGGVANYRQLWSRLTSNKKPREGERKRSCS